MTYFMDIFFWKKDSPCMKCKTVNSKKSCCNIFLDIKTIILDGAIML